MTDIDSNYDPKSGLTLDRHREEEQKTMKQPGFGGGAVKPEEVAEAPIHIEVIDESQAAE